MAPPKGEKYTVGAGNNPPGSDRSTWKRKRESFSCTKDIWERAKTAWSSVRREYPAWTEWLEAALEEKTEAVHAALGVTPENPLPPAPARLPTGRRTPPPVQVDRERRSFTCAPAIWADARAAWWAEEESYPSWTDWVEEAIAEKARRSEEPAASTTH